MPFDHMAIQERREEAAREAYAAVRSEDVVAAEEPVMMLRAIEAMLTHNDVKPSDRQLFRMPFRLNTRDAQETEETLP